MELTIDREKMEAMLADVVAATVRKSEAPGLSRVRLRAHHGDKLELVCSDLKTTMLAEDVARVAKDGICCLPAGKLLDMVKAAPAEEIYIKLGKDATMAAIRAGRASWDLVTGDPEMFPEVPEIGEAKFEMEGEALIRLLGPVIHAVSREETRFNLQGVYLHNEETAGWRRIVAAATDGHRLARSQVTIAGLHPAEPLLISLKAAKQFMALAKGDEAVDICLDGGRAFAFNDGRTIITRPLEGDFPDYKAIIPQKFDHEATVNRLSLAAALKRMNIMASDRFAGVDFTFTESLLTLGSINPDLGNASETMEADFRSDLGKGLGLKLNGRYLLEACGVMQSEQIDLGLADARNAITITGEADPGFLAVIIPMYEGLVV